jgi:GNAT superfamily N-acetyltransferase
VSSCGVLPKYHRQGIGSALIRHCLDIADEAGLPVSLTSFPGAHEVYLKCGFEDFLVHDTDLNAWDNHLFRGYGIYRSYIMVRKPKIKDGADG